MKKQIIFIIAMFGIIYNIDAQWQQVGGDTVPSIRSIAANGQNIYMSATSHFYFSDDNGITWKERDDGLPIQPSEVFEIALSGATILARTVTPIYPTFPTGLYLSTNNCVTWTAIDTGQTGVNLTSIAINGTSFFAGTSQNGIYRSSDNGNNWTTVNTGLTS